MDPIELQIQQRINEIQQTPGFQNYNNAGIAPLVEMPTMDQNFVDQNLTNQNVIDQTLNTSFMPNPEDQAMTAIKKAVTNAAKNKLIDTVAQKVGIDGLTTLTSGLPIMSGIQTFAPQILPFMGIAAIKNKFTGPNVKKRIIAEAAKDQQGTVTTFPTRITNIKPTAQDLARGDKSSGVTKTTSAPTTSTTYQEAQNAFAKSR